MASFLRNRATKIREGAKAKTKPSGWVLEKQAGSFADEGVWYLLSPSTLGFTNRVRTNIDLDVVPLERRTWSA
jgi:NCS1 family nucleobase:cation symporter-1